MATIVVPPKGLTWAKVTSGVAVGATSKTVLTDGYVFYCARCDYTNKTYAAVRGHVGRHARRDPLKPGHRGAGRKTLALADKNVAAALDLIVEAVDEIRKAFANERRPLVTENQMKTVVAQRDAALVRARAAEKKLETLKGLFS